MALYPTTVTDTGFDGATLANALYQTENSLEQICDQLLAATEFDLMQFQQLIDLAQQWVAEAGTVDGSAEKNAILLSAIQVYEARLGRTFTTTQVADFLRDFRIACNTFIADAIANQPKQTSSGAVLLQVRDIVSNKLVPLTVDPVTVPTQVAEVQALRDAIEPPL